MIRAILFINFNVNHEDEVGGRILRGTIGQAYYGSYCQKNIVKLLGELKISINENRSDQQQEIDDENDFSFLTKTPVSRFASAQVYHFFKLVVTTLTLRINTYFSRVAYLNTLGLQDPARPREPSSRIFL